MHSNATNRVTHRDFASLSPLSKIAVWMGTVALCAAVVQSAAWALGLDFHILTHGGGGRGVLMAIALATLLIMIGADRRSAADYGLTVGDNWVRFWWGGMLVGATSYSGYCALLWYFGGAAVRSESLTAYLCFSGLLAAVVTAFPVAIIQQFIFSGYLLSMLRDRYRRVTAVLASSTVFALLYRLEEPLAIFSNQNRQLLVGMFLVAVLLGIVRLRTGSIVLPAGLLAGCILVRRFLRITMLLEVTGDWDVIKWMAPLGDPRQGPVMWIFLSAAIAGCWWALWRYGEAPPAAGTQLHASFKRVFPFSNLKALAPLDVWIGRLWQARFRVGLKYVPRLIAILTLSSINTLLTLPERLLVPWLVRNRRVPHPVFILGVHRSGTTLLHNLLALDGAYCTPRMYQIMDPAGCVFLGRLVSPVLGAFMPWKRPMDAVRLHAFTPQEEEFAVAALSPLSPYWSMTFPREVARYDRFIFTGRLPDKERLAWQRTYLYFLRKLTFWSRKRPLLKSPYNTGRVDVLHEMFPQAKFIHIYRHPEAVYRSNMHLAREGFAVFQLQDADAGDSFQTRFLGNYREQEDSFYRHATSLAEDQVTEVRFEDLEKDPIDQVRRIYQDLGLNFSQTFHLRMERYVEAQSGYRKNRFKPLAVDVRGKIEAVMKDYMDRWGYARNVSVDAAGDADSREAA